MSKIIGGLKNCHDLKAIFCLFIENIFVSSSLMHGQVFGVVLMVSDKTITLNL